MRMPARVLFPLFVAGVLGAAPGSPGGQAASPGEQGFSAAIAGQQTPQPPPGAQAPAAASPLPADAQQPPPPADAQQPPPPRIRSGINYVRVDVFVTDKAGEPVLDLTQDDFSVAEDGKPQKIDAFSVVKLDATAEVESGPPRAIRNDFDEEREAQRPEVRLFVILLDDYHVRRGNDMSVRKPLIDFIENQLAPADMVAIMYPLTPVTDMRFTRDRSIPIRAIERFEGRKFIYTPRNMFEEQYAMYPASTVERVRNQVTMDALKGAAVRMGGLREGRKSIIFVSEGLTTMLPAQLNDPIASMPGFGNPNRGRANAPQPTDMQTLMATADVTHEMQQVFSTLNRQNTSIYAVDPRGLAVFEYGINEGVGLQQDATGLRMSLDTLHALANNTDGRAIVNRNDLASGMKQIIRDSTGYYLLGYNSSQAPTDGKFHGIKVSVKRRGLDVRARKGYWAYTNEDVARANAPAKPEAPTAVTSALKDLVAPARDRSAHFWIGTARGENGATRVTFLWEPAPPIPGQAAETPAARVSLTAVSRDGRPLYRAKVPEQPAASTGTPPVVGVAEGGITSFDVPPGPLDLRIVVEGSRGQVLDSVGRELTVPDFTQVQVSFGTPRVYRVRSVPELQALKAKADAVPTVDREFSRTDRLHIRVDAYAPGGITPTLTARLLNRAGTSMSNLPVQTPAARSAEIDLPLSPLAAGEYLIELNAKTESGTAQELIAFRVGR
jgi:VWFA-related protein